MALEPVAARVFGVELPELLHLFAHLAVAVGYEGRFFFDGAVVDGDVGDLVVAGFEDGLPAGDLLGEFGWFGLDGGGAAYLLSRGRGNRQEACRR